jgi:hypothetical protein
MILMMFDIRKLSGSVWLLSAALVVAAGCGQPAPPPGAPKNFGEASVDLGPESGDKAAESSTAGSTSDGPSPVAPANQPGDAK